MTRRLLFISFALFLLPRAGFSEALPVVDKVAAQPLLAHVKQVEEALDFLGDPLPSAAKQAIAAAADAGDEAKIVRAVQDALDPYCLAGIEINPESRVKAAAGPAEPRLVEQGWRSFLIEVHNQAGVTAELKAQSDSALPMALLRGCLATRRAETGWQSARATWCRR
jgi:hypothetical protein